MSAEVIDLPKPRHRPPPPNPFADPAVREKLIALVEKLLEQQLEHNDTLAKLLRAMSTGPKPPPVA